MPLFGISVFADIIKDLEIRSSSCITHGGLLREGGLNPATGVLLKRREYTHTQRRKPCQDTDTEEKIMCGWRQRLERCLHKPRNISSLQKLGERSGADYPLEQGFPDSRPCTSTSCQRSSSIRLEVKCTKNVKGLNHPQTIPTTPLPPVRGKIVSH